MLRRRAALYACASFLSVSLIALTACGGGGGIGDGGTPSTPTAGPTASATATTVVERDDAWALEQLTPLQLRALEAWRDQRWNDLYDLYATPKCSRSDAVSAFISASVVASAFGGSEFVEASIRDIEEGVWKPAVIEATEDRITYQPEDEPVSIVRADGDWRYEGDPCEEVQTDGTTGEGDQAQLEWDRLVDEWNQLSQSERDSYIQDDQISGFDNWMAQQGYACATDDSGYSCTLESFKAEYGN